MSEPKAGGGADVSRISLVADSVIIETMLRYGGGFAKALARAAQLADSTNLARIKAGWPDYWQRYYYMANSPICVKTQEADQPSDARTHAGT